MLEYLKNLKSYYAIYLIIIFLNVSIAQSQSDSTDNELLRLSDCIQMALKNNCSLKTAEYSDKAAKMDVLGSYQGILPSISASASSGEMETGPSEYLSTEPVGIDAVTGNIIYEQRTRKISEASRKSSSASLTISQNIFDGGIWWNQIRKSKTDKRSSEYNLESQRNNVIFEVQNAYFDLNKQVKLLEVNKLAVQRSQAQLNRTQIMYELGATARLDVFRAKVSLGNDRIVLLRQKNIVEQSKKQLNLTMGRDPFMLLNIEHELPLTPELPQVDDMIQNAFENQPLVKKNEEDIQSRKLSVSMAEGLYYPRLSVYFNHDRRHEELNKIYSDLNQNYTTTYGVQLSFNIFSGFSDYANVQKAKINRRSAQENFEDYKRTLKSTIHQYYSDYESYLDIIEINRDNLEAAKEEFRLADERYKIGAGTSLEVRESQVNLTEAERLLIDTQYNARIVLAQLDNQLGIIYKKLND